MSRTYIGPFGRILPIQDNSDEDSSSIDGQEPPTQTSQSNMTTYQLPPPAIPTRLEFGSDPRPGFSEPKRYDISSQSRRAIEQQRQPFDEPRHPYTTQHGQLPSVSQLLTPGSRSSSASSPYSTHQSQTSSDSRVEQSSSRQSSLGRISPQITVVPYQSAFTPNPYPTASYDSATPSRSTFAGPSAIPPYALPIQPLNGSHLTSFAQPGSLHQRPYPSYAPQPLYAAPVAAGSQNSGQAGAYDYSSAGHARSDQSSTNNSQSVKPLPRVVGERDIPGEGPCWVYEDGSICRKIIDGEAVNAQWGVTKAGKPRKRLAIACTTCREKKIKCDPGEGKCQQCEKVGRECRFTTA
ncbi:MAG: hypothetical protein LQ343_001561 [Gyalolechia ehrenbergii]|nr:MAG: hypothetical protein LQ343_001561 [Gyalolechia ehrenbergii]